jgi:hypothetical protein
MSEQVEVISAGSNPVYEVVVSEDRQTVTIREADNPERNIELISSVVGTLISVLQKLRL